MDDLETTLKEFVKKWSGKSGDGVLEAQCKKLEIKSINDMDEEQKVKLMNSMVKEYLSTFLGHDKLREATKELVTILGLKKRLGRKKATWKDYTITAVLIMFIIVEFDLWTFTQTTILPLIFSDDPSLALNPVRVEQKFQILVPETKSTIRAGSGSAIFWFLNTGFDTVTIKNATLVDPMSGKTCNVTSPLPMEIRSEQKFNLTAEGCGASSALIGESYSMGIILDCQTTQRALLMMDPSSLTPVNLKTLSPEERELIIENLKAQIMSMDGANNPVDFTSSGTVIGAYS